MSPAGSPYHDLGAGYEIAWNGNLRVGGDKASNKAPCFTGLGAGSATAVDANSPIDRFAYIRYNQAF